MKPTRKIMMNGNREFFVAAYYRDGSIAEAGPFASGEAAAAKIVEDEAFERAMTENYWEQDDAFSERLERRVHA